MRAQRTIYTHGHTYGKGASVASKKKANKRASAKTRWANKNPDKLMTATELAEHIRKMEAGEL